MSDEAFPHSEIILYQTEDGRTRIQCRFENETVWLTQAVLAELFQVTVLSRITSKCTTCNHFKVHHFGWVFSAGLRGWLAR